MQQCQLVSSAIKRRRMVCADSRVNDGLKARQRKPGTRSDAATLTSEGGDEAVAGGATGGGQRVVESRVTVAVDIQ